MSGEAVAPPDVRLTGPAVLASVRAALPAWLLARAIVLGFAGYAVWQRHGVPAIGPWQEAGRLEVWDAGVYRLLAEHGYQMYSLVRFFPLLPSVGSALHAIRIPTEPGLTVVCWIAALLFAAALHRLVLLETGDEPAARRSAWLIQLVPGANVLVLAYSEAFAGLLAVGFFIAVRRTRRYGVGAALGVLSGLVRPTGILLSVPAAIELVRTRPSRWLPSALVAVSPIAGTAGFLVWSWYAFHDLLAPYRAQTGADLRGGVLNTNREFLFKTSPGGYPWLFVLVLIAVAVLLLVLCARLLPASYTVWAALMVLAAITASGFHSLPRYLAAAFPLVMAAALTCRRWYVWWPVLAACVISFSWVAYHAFVPGPVP
jgi:hypothetical protein